MAVAFLVDTCSHKVVVEFLHHVVLTLEVNHRTRLTFLIYKEQTRDMGILCHLGIIGTEGRGDMYDTGTILSGDIVTGDHPESLALHLDELILTVLTHEHLLWMSSGISLHIVGSILIEFGRRLYPWHQLLVLQTNEFLTCITAYDTIRHELLTLIVLRHLLTVGDVALGCEVSIQSALCQDDGDLLTTRSKVWWSMPRSKVYPTSSIPP